MGIFDRNEKKADFSNVQSGSSTQPDRTKPQTTGDQPVTNTYTVKSGDSLSAIAKREYGDANEWRRIYEANRDQIEDPDMIQPGQELKIPSRGGDLR